MAWNFSGEQIIDTFLTAASTKNSCTLTQTNHLFCTVNPFFPKYVHISLNFGEELLIFNEFPVQIMFVLIQLNLRIIAEGV